MNAWKSLLPILVLCACDKPTPDTKADADAKSGEATAKSDTKGDAKSDAKADAKSDAEGDAKPDAEADAKSDAIAAKKAEAREAFTKRDATEVEASGKKLVTLLNEGRKLVKAGNLEAGIALYQQILAIDPHYGKAVGELGFAEYKAGKFEAANAHTLQALTLATADDQRGRLTYNLGLIAEKRGDVDAAIQHYAMSLALRPNDIVAKRLAKVSHVEDAAGNTPDTPATPDADPDTPRTPDAPEAPEHPTPSLASLNLGGLLDHVNLAVMGSGLADTQAVCEAAKNKSFCLVDQCEIAKTPSGDDSWGVMFIGDSMLGCYHPIVKTDAGYTVFEAALIAQQGSEVDQDVDRLATRVETNEVGDFLWIDYEDHLYERDWEYDMLAKESVDAEIPGDDITDSKGVILCRRVDTPAGAACSVGLTTAYRSEDGDGQLVASYKSKLSLAGDSVVILGAKTEGSAEYGKPDDVWIELLLLGDGTYPLAELSTVGRR